MRLVPILCHGDLASLMQGEVAPEDGRHEVVR